MDSDTQSHLASLYALETLDASEQALVEAEYVHLQEFQSEVAAVAAVTSMLAYNVDSLSMSPKLKERLFQRLAESDVVSELATIAPLLAQAQAAQWEPYQPTAGVEFAMRRVDPTTRQVEFFVRSVGPIKFPRHRHADREEVIVLDGDLKIEHQVYQTGDRIYSSSETVHQPETLSGCTLLILTSLDDEILL